MQNLLISINFKDISTAAENTLIQVIFIKYLEFNIQWRLLLNNYLPHKIAFIERDSWSSNTPIHSRRKGDFIYGFQMNIVHQQQTLDMYYCVCWRPFPRSPHIHVGMTVSMLSCFFFSFKASLFFWSFYSLLVPPSIASIWVDAHLCHIKLLLNCAAHTSLI